MQLPSDAKKGKTLGVNLKNPLFPTSQYQRFQLGRYKSNNIMFLLSKNITAASEATLWLVKCRFGLSNQSPQIIRVGKTQGSEKKNSPPKTCRQRQKNL